MMIRFIFGLYFVMMSHGSSVPLTDPGTLCAGQRTTLTCNVTGGSSLNWNYIIDQTNDGFIRVYDPDLDVLSPPTGPVERHGVEFTVSLLMPTSPHLLSTISFVPSTMMNGGMLACNGIVGSMVVDSRFTLQVDNAITEPPGNVRLSNIMNGTTTSTITIEWTPPPNATNVTLYTVVITPPPETGPPSSTTNTSITTTVLYNINYTISVSTTCTQLQTATMPFILVDCGVPVFPSSSYGCAGEVTSTTEGGSVSFQCGDGLSLTSGLNSMEIQCTNMGQWMPDPSNLRCSPEGLTTNAPASIISTSSIAPSADSPSQTNADFPVLVFAVSIVLTFLFGIAVGAVGGVLVMCCIHYKGRRGKLDLTPAAPPAPLYEDVGAPPPATTPAPYEDVVVPQLELKENVAYGQVETR